MTRRIHFGARDGWESVTKRLEEARDGSKADCFSTDFLDTPRCWGGFRLTPQVRRAKIWASARPVRRISGRQARGTHFRRVSWWPLREFRMTIMPGSTVQCVNPRCEVKGNWMRAEANGSDHCPACGEELRHVPPPLMPRMRFRPRPAAPRPSLRPR